MIIEPIHPIRDECCSHLADPCEYHAGWIAGYEEGERTWTAVARIAADWRYSNKLIGQVVRRQVEAGL